MIISSLIGQSMTRTLQRTFIQSPRHACQDPHSTRDIKPVLSKMRPSFHLPADGFPSTLFKFGVAGIPMMLLNIVNLCVHSGTLPHQSKLLSIHQFTKTAQNKNLLITGSSIASQFSQVLLKE